MVPEVGPSPPAAAPRPTAATVIAVLGLVYGLPGLLCNPLNAVGNLLAQGADAPDDAIMRVGFDPTYRGGIVVFSVIGLGSCVVLVAACIGLLVDRPWGRRLGLLYSAIALTSAIAFLVFSMVFFFGPLGQLAREANTPQETGRLIGAIIGAGVMALLWFIFPAVMLVVLNSARVAAAYRPRADITYS